MKVFSLIIVLIFTFSCNKSNEYQQENYVRYSSIIDNLNTSQEIENYIRNNFEFYEKFQLKSILEFERSNRNSDIETKKLAKELNLIQSYFKADFDNNGYTDLLVIGDSYNCVSRGEKSCSFDVFVLMNYGKNDIQMHDLIRESGESMVPVISQIEKQPILLIYNGDKIDYLGKKYRDKTIDTLIFKYGAFVEYNSNPASHTIQKLTFHAGPCYGTCPIFYVELVPDGISYFKAVDYNFHNDIDSVFEDIEGCFEVEMDQDKLSEIIGLLNYIDFEYLKNYYQVNWTDSAEFSLEIFYENGKSKKIDDYGMVGTYGLMAVYDKIFDLRYNQNWEKIECRPVSIYF